MLTFLIVVIVFGIVLKLLKLPFDLIFKALLNALMGYIILLIINYFGASFDIAIPVNFFTSLFVGICGIPAVILLLLVVMFF